MNSDSAALAKASYQRAQQSPDFFHRFYQTFFANCPAAQPMFAKTDFPRQHQLLQHAIGLLLSYHGHHQNEPNLLTRVALRHGKEQLAVDPAHYQPFIDALVETVGRFDPEFTEATEDAWRNATADGVEYMKSKS